MEVPTWVKELKAKDELLLYFPYTSNNCYAEFIEHIPHWNPGIRIQYIHEGKVRTDELFYDNYKNDPESYNNWIAYQIS